MAQARWFEMSYSLFMYRLLDLGCTYPVRDRGAALYIGQGGSNVQHSYCGEGRPSCGGGSGRVAGRTDTAASIGQQNIVVPHILDYQIAS